VQAGKREVNDDYRWLRGANYVPSYARNDVQTWLDYDVAVVDRELGYAEKLHLNCVRVFLQVAVYERNPRQFLDNFESFLSLCDQTPHPDDAGGSLIRASANSPTWRTTETRTGWPARGRTVWVPHTGRPWSNMCVTWWGDIGRTGGVLMWDVMNEPYVDVLQHRVRPPGDSTRFWERHWRWFAGSSRVSR